LAKIPDLVRMVEEGEIGIPEFQREFVWSNNQVRDLAESIYRGYPIGLLILYKVPRGQSPSRERYWVLDGQQRLLSLTLIMKGKVEAIRRGRRVTIRLDIWFDPVNEKFEIRQPRTDEERRKWIKLSELLQIEKRLDLEKLLRERGYNSEEQDRISALWATFKADYKVPVHELSEDLSLDDLGNVFVRVNFAGTRVRGADVYSTMIAVTYKDVVKELRDFCTQLPIEIDYGVLIRTFVAFLTDGKVKLGNRVFEQASKLREVLEGKKTLLKDIVDKVKESTKLSIEMLQRRGITKLPSENVIPVMSYYIHKKGRLLPEEEEGLFKWFVLATFFERYSASAETRLDEDLATIKNGGNYRDLIENIRRREGDLRERILAYIDEGNYNELLLYALLRQSGARDFLTGEILTQANSTVHHIFPRKRLAGTSYTELVDDIGNITLLTHASNQKLSADLPENYLQKVPPEVLRAHYIPEDRELWRLENVEKFIRERRERLKEAVEEFFRTL